MRQKKNIIETNIDSIIYDNMSFIPSIYQKDIFDFIIHGVGNAVVKATAGSGKSTTIINAIRLIPPKLKCLFIAFNKEIVKELDKKLQNIDNVDVRTVHSLGLMMIRRNFYGKNIDINEYKYRSYIKNNLNTLTDIDSKILNTREMAQYIDNICELINLGRLNLCQCEKDLLLVADRHDISILDDECDVVLKVMKWGCENIEVIDFTDMVWLPNELNLKPVGLQYDWIFIDEIQDLNDAQRELFLRCFKRGTRFIGVGDKSQCQPRGTKVLMSNGFEKNIEDLVIGDSIISINEDSSWFYDKIIDIRKRIIGRTLKVTCEKDLVTQYSYSHTCYAKYNKEKCKNAYILYLACIKDGFYIGTSQFKNRDFSNIDKVWILEMSDNKEDIEKSADLCSDLYNIPQLGSKICLEQFNYNVSECLNRYSKSFIFPFFIKNVFPNLMDGDLFTIEACNLFPKYMSLISFAELNNGVFVEIKTIERSNEITPVYSLSVEKNKNYIGDDILTHNCIYSFSGSSPESFDKICNLPNTITLPLSISYRCAKNIVRFANNIVPSMEFKEDAVDGDVSFNTSIFDIKNGDMVLCRNKMPLIKLYMRFLRMGIKSFIRGQEIGLNLVKMVNSVNKKELNINLKKDGVFTRLYDILFETRNKLMLKRDLDLKDATISDLVMNQYDSIKALEILSDGINNVDELIKRINNVFQEATDGICLSTIHKAKGLEADNVYILCKSLLPSNLAKKDWEIEQERNLEYVAYTRAKNKLGFVSEKEVSPNAAMIDGTAALTELAYIEKNVCELLGKPSISAMSNEDAAKYATKHATVIKPIEKTNSVKINEKKSDVDDDLSNEELINNLSHLLKNKKNRKKIKKIIEELK